MGNSHKNLLLRNHWANCNQTFEEWSLDGPLPKLCPVIPNPNQDGRQAKNRKSGDKIKKKSSLKLLSQSQPNFIEMILGWSPSEIVSCNPNFHPSQAKYRKRGGWNLKKIFSEITEPISTKLGWNDYWVVLFQNCVRNFRTPTKMATTAELNLT